MRRAFTLLEVIVALAIFALAAIVLGAAYVNVLNAYEAVARGNQSDEDVRFARSQLLAEPDQTKAETGSDFVSTGSRGVKWHATIEATTAIRISFNPRFFSSFITLSQNLAPSVCSIQSPST